MRRKIEVLVTAILLTLGANAQIGEFQIGGRYAMGVSDIQSDALQDPSERLAFNGGFAGMYNASESLKLKVDILGSWKGADNTGEENTGDDIFGDPIIREYQAKYKFIDLEIPMMVSYQLLDGNFRVDLGAGVATNFNLIALESREYENQNYNDNNGYENVKLEDINPAHFSHILSLGFHVGSEDSQRFFFEVRKIGGLNDFGELDGQSANHDRLELGIGYYL